VGSQALRLRGAEADRVVNEPDPEPSALARDGMTPEPAAADSEPPECQDTTCAGCETRRAIELIEAMSYADALRVYVQALLARSPIRCVR
jgi:hypothetical protein